MRVVHVCLLAVTLAGCGERGEKPALEVQPGIDFEQFEDLVEREQRSAKKALDEVKRRQWERRQRKKEEQTGCRATKAHTRKIGSCWI